MASTPSTKLDDERRFTVSPDAAGERLDRWLARLNPDLSRSRIQQLIGQGRITLDSDEKPSASRKVRAGENVRLVIPPAEPVTLAAQNLGLDVVYEDDDLIVVDKPAGLVVHPAAGNPDRTLVNALLAHCGDSLRGIGGEKRPGIVHRLDKETSGLLVAAKTGAAHAHLAAQFAEHSIARAYDALVWGVPSPRNGAIKGQIGRSGVDRKKMAVRRSGGKYAETHYKTLKVYGAAAAWVECVLKTGRTHQIRVHLSSLGHPLIGDPLYGTARSKFLKDLDEDGAKLVRAFRRQALHAHLLGFTHPRTGKRLRFERDPPSDFQALEAALKKSAPRKKRTF